MKNNTSMKPEITPTEALAYEVKVKQLGTRYGIVQCNNCQGLISDLEEICNKCGQVVEIKPLKK